MSQLSKRLIEMKENENNLPKLEDLYYNIAHDIGLINESWKQFLYEIKAVKEKLKFNCKTISEFNREFELTDEFIKLKHFKLESEGLSRIMSAIKMKVESLKAESKGQY